MDSLCHSREDIERALLRLHCVPTDNRSALVALGFEPMYPQAASGYESRLWARSIDAGRVSGSRMDGRKLVIQRAFLATK